LLIETELGFVAGSAIEKPISGEELKSRFPSFFPAFELADVGFYGDQRSTGVDLIAANSASASYLCGRLVPTSGFDPDQQQLDLSVDDEPVYHASSGETLSGQWLALEWLVNSVISKGYRIEPGHIFLTGALGPPQPGRPGKYQADYGELGTVELNII
jgi:2-keto-4-pentenoate hydratase